ncbi:N2227-domain-containing protein [Aaosphaeria arxii CBS 175.79]|uniref:N2227-domain-containing protein n=1 Tax=Aaosphaeria arxii CBS 175.79 TaxID=1450172 RepID=A0A6A5X7N3_9PLEO|nr:N2227-domain-containing protein [Aaosphaeria arxii CBS 175.79]KAF2008930.1 N2227-domain-containing protein [Aaosphaeria arxii CBS 175.79]
MRISPLYLLLSLCPQAILGQKDSDNVEGTIDVNGFNAQDPLQYGSMNPPPRHQRELENLQTRLSKTTGTYNQFHPRYRLLDALWSYSSYQTLNLAELNRWRSLYKNMGKKQRKSLEHLIHYTAKLDRIETEIATNAKLADEIVATALDFYSVSREELDAHVKEEGEKKGRKPDRISVAQTMKHYVRDWAVEGKKERDDAFPCLLEIMKGLKKEMLRVVEGEETEELKVVLPGAGLGRLGSEIDFLGDFEVTINEWSMYMNVAYRFINHPTPRAPDMHTFHPFIDGLSHHATNDDLHRAVTFPELPPWPTVLLVEGDFTTAFNNQEGYYDIVVTHFFIDTARNLISYFETIKKILRKGGKWVNLGPLLYGTGPFVQLSLDEILVVVEGMGFAFEEVVKDGSTDDVCGQPTFEGNKVRSLEAEYGFNGRALTKNAYKAQVWVAKKL